MKSFLPAIVVLSIAAGGLLIALVGPDQNSEEPPPVAAANPKEMEPAADASEPAPIPQTMCNALGILIPVVSDN